MEIYREKINRVEFESPAGAVGLGLEYSYNGGALTTIMPTAVAGETDVYYIDLPYFPNEGTVDVLWKFTSGGVQHVKKQKYNVTTPYISTRWIRKNLMPDSSNEEIAEAEQAARHIINAHTGQTFGRETSTKVAVGDGSSGLALPARLIEITSVNGIEGLPSRWSVTGDGWYVRSQAYGAPHVKADAFGINEVTGPIYNPYSSNFSAFPKGFKYTFAGVWGWEEVPDAVQEAAKLLVNDYACGDAQYRDRYLLSMTAADWRIQFTSGAFARTGNVRADQLLSEYVMKRGWAVI